MLENRLIAKSHILGTFGVEDIRGIVPPIATPITPAETVDEPALRRLVRFHLEQWLHCIFVLGGSGEFYTIADREKDRAHRNRGC
jgi:dihydrodipicolinate synthase/N-acetylneuraminate lyase